MSITGFLRDLRPALSGDTEVTYELELDNQGIDLMPYLGGRIHIEHSGEKACVWCGRKVKKLFPNGSCYPCFRDLPQNDLCVVKPHTCHYETCRDQQWGDAHCMIPTYVYLARSSEIKVGLSRNLPGRWLEQGAVEAVPVALLPTRRQAGELELFLTRHLPDKTNWRRMLQGQVSETPLAEVVQQVLPLIPEEFRSYLLPEAEQRPRSFAYPVSAPVEKIGSLDLEKGPAAGVLVGIKAKYLILAAEGAEPGHVQVINIPKHAGFHVTIDLGKPA